MPSVSTNLLNDLLDLLLPFISTQSELKTFFEQALGTDNLPPNLLQWEGAPREAATQIIGQLSQTELIAMMTQLSISVDNDTQVKNLIQRLTNSDQSMATNPPDAITLPPPSSSPRSRDHIFISYAHADRALIERFANDLRDRGNTVWIDFEGLRGGDVWQQSIVDGIYASAMVLVALSPDSVQSKWVKVELQTALQFNKKIIPLLIRPVTLEVDKAAYQRLGINDIQYRDFTLGYEASFKELLIDLPHPTAGIIGHCQKIIAKLAALPWGLDHFIQEEAKLLPIFANPYEDGVVKSRSENVLERLRHSRRTIVLGEPGRGKTVALQRLAWELASSERPIVPVLITLLEYDGQPLLEWIRLKIIETGEIALTTIEQTKNFLRDMPFDAYFLLDGLNEVRPAYRDQIVGEITRLALEYARHSLVVTSRIQDESWRVLRQGSAVQDTILVQSIRPEQARQYLDAHLGADDAEYLWHSLDGRMRGLASTPLLLWLIKEAWREAKERGGEIRIPENRGELYSNFVTRMLRRDDERRLSNLFSRAERVRALERVALALHRKQQLTLSEEEAGEIVGNTDLLKALLVNGLLLGDETIRFAPHQTMQEHFAARAIKNQFMKNSQGRIQANEVLKYAAETWWAEAFIQLAGLIEDPNMLARALAEVNPWLAWWCVQEGRQVDEATRQVIESRSIALVHSPEVTDRRNAAVVLARLQTLRVVESLAQLVRDSDDEVANQAEQGLRDLGESVVPHILSHLTDVHIKSSRRAQIGRLVGEFGDPRPGVGVKHGVPDIVWCEVPAGTFLMGSDQAKDSLAHDAETPQHEVTLPRFWIAKYPVTYCQYEAFAAGEGYSSPTYWTEAEWQWKKDKTHPEAYWHDPNWHIANHPVVGVTWCEANAFCRWLDAQYRALNLLNTILPQLSLLDSQPLVLRLPTEEEWEKAVRGTDGQIYPYGSKYDPQKENTRDTGIGRTSTVGLFHDGQSPYGALDMSGNVWEWCATKWRSSYAEPDEKASGGENRQVTRGGSWVDIQYHARAAYRFGRHPYFKHLDLGFRVALTAII